MLMQFYSHKINSCPMDIEAWMRANPDRVTIYPDFAPTPRAAHKSKPITAYTNTPAAAATRRQNWLRHLTRTGELMTDEQVEQKFGIKAPYSVAKNINKPHKRPKIIIECRNIGGTKRRTYRAAKVIV